MFLWESDNSLQLFLSCSYEPIQGSAVNNCYFNEFLQKVSLSRLVRISVRSFCWQPLWLFLYKIHVTFLFLFVWGLWTSAETLYILWVVFFVTMFLHITAVYSYCLLNFNLFFLCWINQRQYWSNFPYLFVSHWRFPPQPPQSSFICNFAHKRITQLETVKGKFTFQVCLNPKAHWKM